MSKNSIIFPMNPSKRKRKQLKIVYIPQRGAFPFYKQKIILSLLLGLVVIAIISISLYYYLNPTEDEITELINNGNYYEALAIVNEQLKDEPNDLKALKTKGKIIFLDFLKPNSTSNKEQELNQFIYIFDKIIKTKDPILATSDVYFYLGCGYFYKGENNYKKALRYLEESLKLNQQDKKVDEYLAKYAPNGISLPIDNNPQTDKKNSYRISLFGFLGYITYRLEMYNDSLEYFQAAVKQKNEVIYHFLMALTYDRLKNQDKVIEQCEKVIHREKSADILNNCSILLSKAYFLKKDYEQAEKYIKQSIYLGNKNQISIETKAANYYQLGIIYEAQKQTKKAVQYWKKVLELNPDHTAAKTKLQVRYGSKFKKKKQKKK